MPVSPHLRDRIMRQLDQLNDEKAYVVLDYVEYVATKYGTPPSATANIFSRFAEGIEDTMRAGRLSTSAISQTMGFLNQAVGVLNGVAAAGKSVANDLVTTASDVAKAVAKPSTDAGGGTSTVEGVPPQTPPSPPLDPNSPPSTQ